MKFLLLKALAMAGMVSLTFPAMAQSQNSTQQAPVENSGGFSINLRNQKMTQQQLEKVLPGMLGLNGQNTLKEIKSQTDNFGITHISYQQYFKNILVQDAIVLMHLKGGMVTSVTGAVQRVPDDFPMPSNQITSESAINFAKKYLGIFKLIRQYPAKLVIVKNKAGEGNPYVLAWDVRIDGRNINAIIQMNRVFVNAQTGEVIHTYPLIDDADVTANAETLYRGLKKITVDSLNDSTYRLRDNARKIYTFNAGGVMQDTSSNPTGPFAQDIDYFNPTINWGDVKTLYSLSIDSLADTSILNNGILIAGIGQGIFTSFFASNFLTVNILYPPYTLPLETQGMGVQMSNDSLYGVLAKINFQYQVLDSLYFKITDTSIGTHLWNDTLGNYIHYSIDMEKNPALDAHWGMEQTHDYYLTVFNRNSYDGQGSEVRNYINGMMAYSGTQDNAAALPAPYNSMVYGLGDGILMGPVVGLDIMGHEFTHMVTANNAYGGLNYQDQPGALNESFSDMMGTAIEFFADSAHANWTIGENVILTSPFYMRSMSNPKGPANAGPNFQPQPDTYLGEYWYTGNQDDGGVHINSGVSNKWFYLLSEGGTGTNDNNYHYQVTGLGIKKAEKIAYEAFTQYLNPNATFIDAYNGSLEAVSDLYGQNSPEYHSVQTAWWAVGVPNDNDTTTGIRPMLTHNNCVNIYPNPTISQVTVASSLNQPFKVTIYSITGAEIRSIIVHQGQNVINVSDLSRGTYFLKYEVNQQLYAEKLVLL